MTVRMRYILILLLTIPHSSCDQQAETASKAVPLPALEYVAPILKAEIETARGLIVIDLQTEDAPVLCANFANLVQRKFFDGLSFYRSSTVIRQAGNPHESETRQYSPGYRLLPEFSPELTFNTAGMVACVFFSDQDPPDVRPTEFFLTVRPQPRWTFEYPIFATISEGLSVAGSLEDGDRIQSIQLIGDPAPLLDVHAEQVANWNLQLDANPPDLDRRRRGP